VPVAIDPSPVAPELVLQLTSDNDEAEPPEPATAFDVPENAWAPAEELVPIAVAVA
jgi:hypothetical protein